LPYALGPHGTTLDKPRERPRFIDRREDAAFNVLVRRHGALVFNVCKNVLKRDVGAEDAFQATFLVLARKANAVRKERSIAGWLHGHGSKARRFRKLVATGGIELLESEAMRFGSRSVTQKKWPLPRLDASKPNTSNRLRRFSQRPNGPTIWPLRKTFSVVLISKMADAAREFVTVY
jgi:hypothetical protein